MLAQFGTCDLVKEPHRECGPGWRFEYHLSIADERDGYAVHPASTPEKSEAELAIERAYSAGYKAGYTKGFSDGFRSMSESL